MDTFEKLIDNFIADYDLYSKGNISFENQYGDLIFYKNDDDILILYGIYIYPEYRNKGLCRDILHYIIDKCHNKFKYFCVESVISNILYDYLSRFKYKNKKFKITDDWFIYKIK